MILTIFVTAVLGILFLLVAIPFILHVIDQDKDSKYGGIYTVESPYYRIKYIIFLLLLKIRAFRNRASKPKMFDIKEKRFFKSIEKPQSLTSEYSIDSVYFFCTGKLTVNKSDTTKTVDVIIRMARRKDRIHEFWMAIKQDQEPLLVHPNCPETSVTNCSPNQWNSISGLSISCDRPMEKWTIKYHGWLKEDKSNNKLVHVNLKLCFRAFSNIIDSHKDSVNELTADSVARERWNQQFFDDLKNFAEKNQTHYEQWGAYDGRLVIDRHEEYLLNNGKGYRDHSFGIRNWSQYQRYGVIFGHMQNGASFSLGSICCRSTLSHIRFGYYITPYSGTQPMTSHNFNLWEQFLCSPPKSKIIIEFYAGQKFVLEISKSAEVNFDLNKGKTIIIERFVDFKLNGIAGKGVAEFCASDAVPRYKQIDNNSIDILKKDYPKGSKRLCVSLENDECRDRDLSGGKGCHLADLRKIQSCQNDVKIPKGFIVTTESYKAFVKANPSIPTAINTLVKAIRESNSQNIDSICEILKSNILNGEIPEDIRLSIVTEHQRIFGDDWNTLSYSVRSSSADEDSAGSSSAGQMATFLGVKELENINDSIKKCWASQFSSTAVSYRIRNGQPINTVMAIVIMEMIQSNTSGVLFTVNPVNGDSTRMIISASYGLGEVIVSGKGGTDNYEIEKQFDGATKIISKLIGNKKIRVDENPNEGGINENEVSNPCEFCLTDDIILKLSNIGILIEQCYGEPCDIEWAECDGSIFLLQTRPITNLNVETDEELAQEFDTAVAYDGECLTTSNIGEMMPMAATPLTLSVFGSAIEKSFHRIVNEIGLISHDLIPRRFLCSYNNNMFLNIHELALLSDKNNFDILFQAILGRFVDNPSKDDLVRFTGTKSFTRRIFAFVTRLVNMKSGRTKTSEWERKFQIGYRVPLKSNATRQMKTILDHINDYYTCWHDTVQNSSCSAFWNMILLKSLKDESGWNNKLHSKMASLLSSCTNIVSADVPNTLKKISIAISKDEDSKHFFLTESDETCLEWLNSSESKKVGELFQDFLDHHGHRCIREAEFREHSWRTSPEKIISVIKAMVSRINVDDFKEKQEISAESALNNLHIDCNFIKKKLMTWLIEKARHGVGLREWGKSISIQMCDAFKESFNHLGQLMAKENIIQEADLIYFFTFDELVSVLVDKDEKISNLSGRIQRRKKILQNQMIIKMPELVFGKPYNLLEYDADNDQENMGKSKFSGLPVSVGKVKGICRVISTLKEAVEIQSGEILVVPYTDVGWTPFFPLLSGLITEKGSILSHGAVVAREYGLPCIVGCIGATKILKTGDQIILNASEGIVDIC